MNHPGALRQLFTPGLFQWRELLQAADIKCMVAEFIVQWHQQLGLIGGFFISQLHLVELQLPGLPQGVNDSGFLGEGLALLLQLIGLL